MTETLPAILPRASGLVALHRYELNPERKVDGYSKLLPEPTLRGLVAQLEAELRPSGNEVGEKQARVLIGSYPAREVNDPKVFVRAITSVLADAPVDLGVQAVDHLTKHLRWLPTRADVFAVVDRLVTDRRRMLSAAKAQLAEHARRATAEKPPSFADLTPEQKAAHERMMRGAVKRLRGESDDIARKKHAESAARTLDQMREAGMWPPAHAGSREA